MTGALLLCILSRGIIHVISTTFYDVELRRLRFSEAACWSCQFLAGSLLIFPAPDLLTLHCSLCRISLTRKPKLVFSKVFTGKYIITGGKK